MFRIFAAVFSLALLYGPSPARGFQVFQDPSCTPPGTTAALPTDANSVVLTLCIHQDGQLSDPNLACSGAGGDEFCGWDLKIEATGGARLEEFTKEPSEDIVFHLDPNTGDVLRANGGDPILGQVGAVPLGTLRVSASSSPGTVDVTANPGDRGNVYVTSALTAEPIPFARLAEAVGCVDEDDDLICDPVDACPGGQNTLPLCDTNGDNIPDDCQCGDFNGSGTLTGTDARSINKCSTGSLPPEDCPLDLLDVNLSDTLTGTDARNVNKASTGSLQTYELMCDRRPSGEPPPDISLACALPGVSCGCP
jgi:hypothetical protein